MCRKTLEEFVNINSVFANDAFSSSANYPHSVGTV